MNQSDLALLGGAVLFYLSLVAIAFFGSWLWRVAPGFTSWLLLISGAVVTGIWSVWLLYLSFVVISCFAQAAIHFIYP